MGGEWGPKIIEGHENMNRGSYKIRGKEEFLAELSLSLFSTHSPAFSGHAGMGWTWAIRQDSMRVLLSGLWWGYGWQEYPGDILNGHTDGEEH